MLCDGLKLSERAAKQAATLSAELPAKFACMHWRGSDFFSPDPLSRLHGKSMGSQFRGLANASFLAAAAARAARSVGAAHILVLTNANWERTTAFRAALAAQKPGAAAGDTPVTATVRSCSDMPPDAEKHVCAHRAAALLLSGASSFSTHIARLARPRGVPVVYLSSCPSRLSPLWREGLLSGTSLPCS